MTSIIGIPTTRVSNQFVRQRLLTQTQYDQLELFRIQSQLSTGHRYQLPSDDPISSLRVMSIQKLLERKEQVQSNLSTNLSFLTTTDTAMSSIAKIVSDVRADALSAVGTTATDDQREAISLQIGQAIRQLVDIGNQKFRSRYLFAGSTTQTQPFDYTDDKYIEYSGNEDALLSYADIDLLFQTNVPGSEVFGAISKGVEGSTDLNPSLTFDTRLADLRGGRGIGMGSITVSDGQRKTTVDISGAETIGDVAMLIRNNPPPGRTVDVEVTNSGLKLKLVPSADPLDSENLIVQEVGGGTTAADLGILEKTGVGNDWLVGEDLDPTLTKTTSLNDILGRRAYAAVRLSGTNNDFIVKATTAGTSLNDVNIIFNADPTVVVGNETVVYDDSDPANKTLTINIEAGQTQIHHITEAIHNACEGGSVPFDAWLDPLDATTGSFVAIPTPPGGSEGVTGGGTEPPFDKTSGIQITNGGKTYTYDFSDAETMEDILNILNASAAGVLAEINKDGTGINVRSRLSGCDFTIGENGGQTATQLGLRTFTDQTRLEDLNYGLGVPQWEVGASTDDSVQSNTLVRSSVSFNLLGENNSLTFTARAYGAMWNGVQVQFVPGGPGAESLLYDRYAGTMTFTVDPASTTLSDIAQLVAADPMANADFAVTLPDELNQPTAAQQLIDAGTLTTAGAEDKGIDMEITRADGVKLQIDLTGCLTIEDVRNRINNHPDNTPLPGLTTPALQARLATTGNGVVLVDTTGPGELIVANTTMSTAATGLGWVPKGETQASVESTAGTLTFAANDVNPQETEGIFTALIRLRDALDANDVQGVQRAMEVLDTATLNSTFVRAELGTREKSLDTLGQRLEDEDVELKSVLSLEYDSDFVEVVSNLIARQAALQASLQATGKIFEMTLLNYI
jgi:flagellin-like hook-associated protein FlgL